VHFAVFAGADGGARSELVQMRHGLLRVCADGR
jgi:hypothetical protein